MSQPRMPRGEEPGPVPGDDHRVPWAGRGGGVDPVAARRAEELVAAELAGLYRAARALVGPGAEAEDVVGDTVVRALEHPGDLASAASPRAWLHRVLHNIAVDRVRHHAHEIAVDEVEALWRDDAYSVDAAAVAETAAAREDLLDSLARLPFGHRAALVLHDAEGWPVAEVAQALGIGLSAAKQRLRRGRMMLVTALAERKERQMATKGVPLTCWEARRQVPDYVEGELEPSERAALEAHLAACQTCPPLYSALVGVQASLGTLRDPDSVVPPSLARRIQARLDLS